MKIRMLVAAAVVVAGTTWASPAQAATSPAPDPGAIVAFIPTPGVPTTGTATPIAVPATKAATTGAYQVKCYIARTSWSAVAAFNKVIYTMGINYYWCTAMPVPIGPGTRFISSEWDDATINSHATEGTATWAQIIGWNYQGWAPTGNIGITWHPMAHPSLRTMLSFQRTMWWKHCTIGNFAWCVDSFPWINFEAWNNGTYDAHAGFGS